MPIKKQNSSTNTFHGLEKELITIAMPKVFLDNLKLRLKVLSVEMTAEEVIPYLTMIGAIEKDLVSVFRNWRDSL